MGWIRVIAPLSHALIPNAKKFAICIIDEIYQHRIFHRDKYIMSRDAQLKRARQDLSSRGQLKSGKRRERPFRSVKLHWPSKDRAYIRL